VCWVCVCGVVHLSYLPFRAPRSQVGRCFEFCGRAPHLSSVATACTHALHDAVDEQSASKREENERLPCLCARAKQARARRSRHGYAVAAASE
jgi:hypothetical protein